MSERSTMCHLGYALIQDGTDGDPVFFAGFSPTKQVRWTSATDMRDHGAAVVIYKAKQHAWQAADDIASLGYAGKVEIMQLGTGFTQWRDA